MMCVMSQVLRSVTSHRSQVLFRVSCLLHVVINQKTPKPSQTFFPEKQISPYQTQKMTFGTFFNQFFRREVPKNARIQTVQKTVRQTDVSKTAARGVATTATSKHPPEPEEVFGFDDYVSVISFLHEPAIFRCPHTTLLVSGGLVHMVLLPDVVSRLYETRAV